MNILKTELSLTKYKLKRTVQDFGSTNIAVAMDVPPKIDMNLPLRVREKFKYV